MQASKRFTGEALLALRKEIAEAGDNEVFALGFCDDKGRVESLEILARGNEDSVPAVRSFFDRTDGKDNHADVFIHNHPSGFLVPSDNDLSVSAGAAESGMGAYIVDNNVDKIYVVAEPVRRRKRENIDAEKLCAALEEGGKLALILPSYEKREAQLALIKLVSRAFNSDSSAAAEAGTGVGKSFAYLLPALEFALLNNERVVISTATINLQQQLFEKDIPFVTGSLGKKVKAALMKGRGNYLCRRRLAEALAEPLDKTEEKDLSAIAGWAKTSKTGSRSDLHFMPAEGIWGRICSESDTCMGMRCPEHERCFFLALRRECADARILVVNHHLLFADLAARYEGAGYESAVVLPPYTRVIIDEAHNIENSATSFFSKEFSRIGINRALGRLYRKRRNRESGLLVRLAALTGPALSGSESLVNKKIPGAIVRVREWAEKADAAALSLCGEEGVYRLVSGRSSEFAEALLFPALTELRRETGILAGLVREMLEQAGEASASKRPGRTDEQAGTFSGPANPLDSAVWEIKSVVRRLESTASVCAAFLDYKENPNDVHWMEKQNGKAFSPGRLDPWALFSATPVDVAPYVRDALFAANKTVICLSATLTIADSSDPASFAYWAGRSGAALAEKELLTGFFPSPFPYAERTLLAVPADAPPPESPAYQDFVNNAVAELAAASGGSALVLFTSYQSLRTAYQTAHSRLEARGIRCLRQGDDDRSRLLADFLADESSVLFATDSFWEGVDAPGDTLRLVILCRLPFRTPKEPVFEARRELLQQRGANPFMELSLPDAVMKFKQGFGRLMRRSSDYGVVAVLDNRVLKKFYGQAFLRSLPETKTSFKEFDSVIYDVDHFLFS